MDTSKFNPYHAKGTVMFGRFRRFFLGSQNPGLFTRINCNIAILYFFYIFLWTLAVFTAFKFGQNLPKAQNWNRLFYEVGLKYNIPDMHFAFSLYLLTLLGLSAVLFMGIIMVWRRMLKGFWIVIMATLCCCAASPVILGLAYVKHECGWWDFVFPGLVVILFTIDFFIKRRRIMPAHED